MFKNLLGREPVSAEDPMDEVNEGRQIVCIDCATQFELVPGEVDFFLTRGLMLPKRCKPCRTERSHSPAPSGVTQGSQKTKPDYNPHEIVCENCDKTATVPFPPAPGKPVYCKICWEGIKNLPLSTQR